MFENVSYKKKFFVLIGLAIILGITAYKRSYKLTLEAYQLVQEAKEQLAKVNNSQQKIANLKEEVGYLDKLIGKEAANPDVVQQEILHTFSKSHNNAKLVKLDKIHHASNEYFNIYTNRLLISGTYNELLKATYDYETQFDFSRVVSIQFFTEKELRTNRKKLFEQIIFQNYEKIY